MIKFIIRNNSTRDIWFYKITIFIKVLFKKFYFSFILFVHEIIYNL